MFSLILALAMTTGHHGRVAHPAPNHRPSGTVTAPQYGYGGALGYGQYGAAGYGGNQYGAGYGLGYAAGYRAGIGTGLGYGSGYGYGQYGAGYGGAGYGYGAGFIQPVQPFVGPTANPDDYYFSW